MAYPYQKHIWVTREIIRREYLQNIEDGIYDEQQERLQADAELAQDLADEVSRATDAEDALTAALQAESTRAQTAESAETTRAQSAENNLSNRISAEVTRATGVEESLSDDIDSLDERISNEYTRATTAESSLGTRVSTLETSGFVKNTDYATLSKAGIVKPDGVTTSIDANGVISATGGGSAVEKAYKTNDSASTTIDDTDYVPMSTSSETRKKALWSTIIAKIKVALGIVSGGTGYLKKDGTWSNPSKSDVGLGNVDNTADANKSVFYASNAGHLENFECNNAIGHDANEVNDNAISYYTSNGPSTSLGASTTDGALYAQANNNLWVAQIAQDYRNGNLFTRGKNNGTWKSWKKVSYVNEVDDITHGLVKQKCTGTSAVNNSGSTIKNGRYFYRDNILCRATADISADGTLTTTNHYVVSAVTSEGALNELGTTDVLWSGLTNDSTSKSLAYSVYRYRFIDVCIQTNVEYDHIYIPVATLQLNKGYIRTAFAAESSGQVTNWDYQTSIFVTFTSSYAFKAKALYTNTNWKLAVCGVYGIK